MKSSGDCAEIGQTDAKYEGRKIFSAKIMQHKGTENILCIIIYVLNK